jgi:glycosyltransferase involved in cell wall biosynthesis
VPIHLKLALARLKENPMYAHHIKEELKKIKPPVTYEIISNLTYNQLPNYYHSLDLYVHPSKTTSVDKAGLEAAFCGVPVLLSKQGYQSTFPNHESLFNPNINDELTQKISRALTDTSSFKVEVSLLNTYAINNLMGQIVKFII